ncbi:uncharacterized protein Z518_06183 [Rhinocladiella mackenziei CBS 650.93]|uniref:Alpha/beta hydrolase fold-3 domain-containing protein n=1 Tax=Rhinocladiella mackenziei CBS 650.93 TaxID=1442369 RepID=A0A0D2IQ44_9EURO|nr:uncharacterized protein Z518_06183 [Rhinocladiella mackenziei CBS 650.93]KIX05311.1 hypothetical protein Z518_06183 [Rhinocladiella mackenziei CBS 650.93]
MFHKPNLDHMRLIRRQAEKQLVSSLGPLNSGLEEFYSSVPLPDGHQGEIKITRPKEAIPTGRPFIVLFHGGGFSGGSVEYMTRPARDFALEFGAVVVSATYRLAPEYKFPIPMQDSWDTLVWLAKNAVPLGANPSLGFVVGGVSAGGTMAAVLTQLAHDRALDPPLTGSFVSIPLLLVKDIVPAEYKKDWTSMEENKNNPSLNKEAIKNIIRTLAPDVKSPLFSPFNSPTPHVGLPPTYVHVGGLDVLRDDGLIYERALRKNGVPTRCDSYPELGHAAWTIYATGYNRERMAANTMNGMRWLLSREGKKTP